MILRTDYLTGSHKHIVNSYELCNAYNDADPAEILKWLVFHFFQIWKVFLGVII